MVEAAKATARKPPKGGRKGGTIYPHISLQKALDYGKKLVSKTHIGSQPEDEILPGVFGNSGPDGKVRASALKQFGLMQGDATAYEATQLAKDIEAALPEGRPALLQRAVLSSKIFNKIFDTFHGDTISKAQISKRAKELDVHPESADECAELFVDSAITSELGTMSGESLVLLNAGTVASPAPESTESAESKQEEHTEVTAAKTGASAKADVAHANKPSLTVSINVDSSSDPEKLEKQLKLLRDYGVI